MENNVKPLFSIPEALVVDDGAMEALGSTDDALNKFRGAVVVVVVVAVVSPYLYR